jgi:hypothetical protein
MHSLKYEPNIIPFIIITSYKSFQYFTKHTIFNKMYSREYIIAGMHSLECIPKIEDPKAALVIFRNSRGILVILEVSRHFGHFRILRVFWSI